MRKILALILILATVGAVLCSCGESEKLYTFSDVELKVYHKGEDVTEKTMTDEVVLALQMLNEFYSGYTLKITSDKIYFLSNAEESASGYKYTRKGNRLEIAKSDFEKLAKTLGLINKVDISDLNIYFLQETDAVSFIFESIVQYEGEKVSSAYHLNFIEKKDSKGV